MAGKQIVYNENARHALMRASTSSRMR